MRRWIDTALTVGWILASLSASAQQERGPARAEKARQCYMQIMEMRRHKIAEQDFKGLIKLYAMYPDNYRFADEWEQLEKLRQEDLKTIKKEFEIQQADVNALVAAGKPKEALALMERMKERYPEEILKEAAFQTYRDGAASAYKMALQGQFDEAVLKLDELAGRPCFAAIQDEIRSEKADIGLLREYMASVCKGGKALKGTEFKVGGIGATLLAVEAETITVESAGKPKTKRLAQLRPGELNDLAIAGGFTKDNNMGQLHLRCAIFYHFNGDGANSAEELLKACDEGANIDRYRYWLKE